MNFKSWQFSNTPIYNYLQVYQLEGSLEDALKQWNSYHHALQKVTQILTETEYALHRYSTASGDIHAFTDQIKQLKVRLFQCQLHVRQSNQMMQLIMSFYVTVHNFFQLGFKAVETQLKGSEKDLNELVKCGNHLICVCDRIVSQAVDRTLSNVRERYRLYFIMNKSCVKHNSWLRHNVHPKCRHDVQKRHLVLISINLPKASKKTMCPPK